VVVIVRAKVVFVVELAGVTFVAYCAVEEADRCREGVVSLRIVLVMHGGELIGVDVLVAWPGLRKFCQSFREVNQ
jgi:hypothetical protein